MGVLAMKIELVIVLSKFNFHDLAEREIEIAADTITLAAKDGIRLKVTHRKEIEVKSGW